MNTVARHLITLLLLISAGLRGYDVAANYIISIRPGPETVAFGRTSSPSRLCQAMSPMCEFAAISP
jgi:hypothetical protein